MERFIADNIPDASQTGLATMTADRSQPLAQEFQSKPLSSSEAIDVPTNLKPLLDHLTQGLVLLGDELQMVYANTCAHLFLQELLSHAENPKQLPHCLHELCQYFLEQGDRNHKTLLMHEYLTQNGTLLQIQISWFVVPPTPPLLLLTIIDRATVRQQCLWFEQQTYGLTDRETRVWQLLQEQLSYQDIADCLEISLNTVKTHVKNIYAKRRIPRKQSPFWFSSVPNS
jgi:DNA-binding CsgD family transcriptional regulator